MVRGQFRNYFFGLHHHQLSSSYLLGASLGIFGALLYACASWVTQRYGKVSLLLGYLLQWVAVDWSLLEKW